MEEQWKDVPGYEDYQASDQGRIKSLKYGKERILKEVSQMNGYLSVSLSKDGKRGTDFIHQLVALCFLDHEVSGRELHIDHINNIKTDNRSVNLQILSASNNIRKSLSNKTSKHIGVYWHNQHSKWKAQVVINSKPYHILYSDDELVAAKAYEFAFENKHLHNGNNKEFRELIKSLIQM